MSPGDVWLFMKKIKLIFVHEIYDIVKQCGDSPHCMFMI